MTRLANFLPPHLLRSLARPPARLTRVERFRAALLFSDVTGFTGIKGEAGSGKSRLKHEAGKAGGCPVAC